MKGIQYLTDAEGNRLAVQIDLREWGELWEDLYDSMVAYERSGEGTDTWDEIKDSLRDSGKLDE